MLSYHIKNPPGVRKKAGIPSHIESAMLFDSKEEVFNRHYGKCFFKINDRVQFKKPKRNRIHGTITYIESNLKNVTWTNGGRSPAIVTVKLDPSAANPKGLTVKTAIKSIIFSIK